MSSSRSKSTNTSKTQQYRKDVVRLFTTFLCVGLILAGFEVLEITYIKIPDVYLGSIIIASFLTLFWEYKKHRIELDTFAYTVESLAVLVLITLIFVGYSYLSIQFQIYSLSYIRWLGLAVVVFLSTTIFYGVYYMLMYLLGYRGLGIIWTLLKENIISRKISLGDIRGFLIGILIVILLGYIEYESQLSTASTSFFNITQALAIATGAMIAIVPLFLLGLMQLPDRSVSKFLKKRIPLHKMMKLVSTAEQRLIYSFVAFLVSIILTDAVHVSFIQYLSNTFQTYNFTSFTVVIQYTFNLLNVIFSEVYFFTFIIGVVFLIIGIYFFQKAFKELAQNLK